MHHVTVAITVITATPVQAADYATRVLNREVYEVVKVQGVLDAVRKIMPAKDHGGWAKWVKNGVSAPMEECSGVVFGFGCQSHNCLT